MPGPEGTPPRLATGVRLTRPGRGIFILMVLCSVGCSMREMTRNFNAGTIMSPTEAGRLIRPKCGKALRLQAMTYNSDARTNFSLRQAKVAAK